MNDFDNMLLQHKQRHEKDFTKEQLQHHLVECLELLEKWDTHLYAELIDLIQIAKVHLQQNLNEDQRNELIERRYEKFMSKIQQNK